MPRRATAYPFVYHCDKKATSFVYFFLRKITPFTNLFDPLTPIQASSQKWILLDIFSLDISQNSCNLLKMHLQLDNMPFFPLALRFMTFLLGHAQKSKFRDMTYILMFFSFSFFFQFFFFSLSYLFAAVLHLQLPLGLLAGQKIFMRKQH